jgi:phage terminase small subunit
MTSEVKEPVKRKRSKRGSREIGFIFRRRLFVNAYLANGLDVKKAGIAAGFPPETAGIQGSKIIKEPEVANLIAREAEKAVAAAGLTIERTLLEIARIAYADPGRLFSLQGEALAIDELSDDMRAVISRVKLDSTTGRPTEYYLSDKISALQMAMKYFGLFERDNAQLAPNMTINIALVGPP